MTTAVSGNQIALFLVVLARVGGLVAGAPVVGDNEVPRRVKAMLAIVLSFVVMQLPALAKSLVPSALTPFALMIVTQLLIGISLGFVARLVFYVAQTAGEIVSLQIGLSMASVFNPLTKEPNQVMSQLFTVIAAMTFLALHGDLWLVASLARSFDLAPLGAPVLMGGLAAHAAGLIVSVTQLGLQIAMPIVASLFAATVVMGLISRSLPQLNIFMLSLPVNVLLGLCALIAGLAATVMLIGNLVDQLPRAMLSLTQ